MIFAKSDPKSNGSFGYLDADCMINVLSYVSQYDLFALSVVNSAMNNLIHSTASLWSHLFIDNINFLKHHTKYSRLMKFVRSISLPEEIADWSDSAIRRKKLTKFLKSMKHLSLIDVDSTIDVNIY